MSYRKIDPRMWDDERFATLSQPTKLVWLLILTGPHTTPLPGLSNVGVAALAESSRYDADTVSRALAELSRAGMVEFNQTCRVLRVPNAPKYNPCSNPKVLKGWFSIFKSVPDCTEKFRHLASLRAAIPAEEPWANAAWAATFGSVAIPPRYATDTVSDTVSDTLAISVSGAVAGTGASTGTELPERAEHVAATAPVQPSPKVKPPRASDAPEEPPADPEARAVYDAIVGDPMLGPVTRRPADLAVRLTAPGAFPGVAVLSQVLRAATWNAGQRKPKRDGRAFLLGWLGRSDPEAPSSGGSASRVDPREAERAAENEEIERLREAYYRDNPLPLGGLAS